MSRLLLALPLIVFAGCLNDVSDGNPFEAAGRGVASAAALEYGSCQDACGGVSDDGCWCDDLCATYGDCCQDYEAACVEPAPDDDKCLFDSDCGQGLRCDVQLSAPDGGPCCPPNAMCIAIMPVCSGTCVVAEPEPPLDDNQCASDADCGEGQHCQAIQCIMAPCPPGICQDDPAPAADSCQDACGGSSSDGSCYCDAYCTAWGDCCDDFAQVCGE